MSLASLLGYSKPPIKHIKILLVRTGHFVKKTALQLVNCITFSPNIKGSTCIKLLIHRYHSIMFYGPTAKVTLPALRPALTTSKIQNKDCSISPQPTLDYINDDASNYWFNFSTS